MEYLLLFVMLLCLIINYMFIAKIIEENSKNIKKRREEIIKELLKNREDL